MTNSPSASNGLHSHHRTQPVSCSTKMAITNSVNGADSVNGANGSQKSALVSVDEFVGQSYDYVICGGGTAGLVIAARLTENPDVTVGVIEAGKNRLDDPLVDMPAMFLQMLGNKEYDYAWNTIPQVRKRQYSPYPRVRTNNGL
jgi:hypothetical protein